ncbi:uncharacterized protein RJT20DRAFT_129026 [Scheffersomyces xylosifermentans]|uniref:uncharacterized protein n=1 Tax=Scheffersomyces xylosifermentans TaxID=1304137 RepID=UPI00315C8AB8
MAVYGKHGRAKKLHISSEVSVFSSDEEESETSNVTFTASDRLVKVIQDSSVETKLSENDLWPSAKIGNMRSPLKSPKSSKKNSIIEDSYYGDSITTSPKKLIKVVNAIGNSPTGASPRRDQTKRKLEDQLREEAGNSENFGSSNIKINKKKKTANGNNGNANNGSMKSKKKVALFASPKVTHKEEHAWDSLFDSIGDESSGLNNSLNIQSDTSEDETVKENTEDGIENLLTSVNNVIDAARISELPEEATTEDLKKADTKIQTPQVRMYGEERSYLLDCEEEHLDTQKRTIKEELSEQISKKNDFNDMDESTVSIDDLRASGRINQDREELMYVLEGLKFSEEENRGFQNSELITSLVLLQQKLKEIGSLDLHRGTLIMNKLIDLLRTAEKRSSNDMTLYQWLLSSTICIVVSLSKADARDKYVARYTEELPKVLKYLGNKVETDKLSRPNQNLIAQVIKESSPTLTIQSEFIESFRSVPQFQRCEVYEFVSDALLKAKSDGDKRRLFAYLETYFERSREVCNLTALRKVISQAFDRIADKTPTEFDVSVLKLLLLSTNYDKDNEVSDIILELIPERILFNQINYTFELLNSEQPNSRDMDVSFFILGFMMNIIDSKKFKVQAEDIQGTCNLVSVFYQADKQREEKKSLEKVKDSAQSNKEGEKVIIEDQVSLFIGYATLVLASLKIRDPPIVQIDEECLMHRLIDFKKQVANKTMENEIDRIYEQLRRKRE